VRRHKGRQAVQPRRRAGPGRRARARPGRAEPRCVAPTGRESTPSSLSRRPMLPLRMRGSEPNHATDATARHAEAAARAAPGKTTRGCSDSRTSEVTERSLARRQVWSAATGLSLSNSQPFSPSGANKFERANHKESDASAEAGWPQNQNHWRLRADGPHPIFSPPDDLLKARQGKRRCGSVEPAGRERLHCPAPRHDAAVFSLLPTSTTRFTR